MDAYLNELVAYLVAQSSQIAVLTMVVAVAAFALRRRSAHVRYLLWMIVLAKCLVPPLYLVPVRVLPETVPERVPPILSGAIWGDEHSRFPGAAISTVRREAPESVLPQSTSQISEPRLSVSAWLGVLWIAGAGGYLMMNLLRAWRGSHWLRRARRPLADDAKADMADLLPAYGIRRLPRIWIVEGVGQAFVWGLLRGSIYIPPGFFTIESPDHRRDVLAHELSHVLRFDPAVNTLQVIVQGLFWFHPLVWWANRNIRREREKCCDEMAVARLGATPKDYSTALVTTLIQAQESTRPVPSLAVAGPVKNIEERIRAMLRPGKKFHKRPSLIAATIVLLVALLTVPTALVLTARAQTEPAEAKTNAPQTLHQAAAAGDLEQVKKSIADGANVNATEGDENSTPLHAAASEGHAQVVKALLEAGAKVDTGDSHGCTPLYYAIWSDDNATVKALIAGGADVNVLPGPEDYPPLIYAIWQNHADNVRTLLEAGATLDHRDASGCTPLYWAAFTSGGAYAINRSILDMILAKGDYEDTIYLAACRGQLDKVKTLIEAGTDVNRRDEFRCTPLQWAVLADSPAVAEFLIAKGADIAAKDTMECTPLTVARGPAMVELLLSKGANVNAQTTRTGWTRLHNACFAGDKEVAELLLRKGADINAKSSSNMTPLRFAAQRGHAELVELLIANGADVNTADNRGRTALSIARQLKHTGVVEILLKHGAKETLHAAIAAGDIDAIKQMVSQGVDINAKDGDGRTPLHLAATQGRKAIAELLIENGANIKAQTKDGETPLHLAANRNHKEVVGTLIDRGADIEARENRYGSTPLLNAAARGHKEVVELLLDRGADIEGKNSDGGTPLSLTAAYGTAIRTDIIQLLLDRGADIETRSNGDSTPLQAAVAVGRREVAELLLAHGAKLDVVSKHWGTTANHAMRSNHPDLVHWCIAKGVEVPPVHQAAYFGEADRVRALLRAGADVNQKDKGGFAPLHCAVFGQRSEVAQLLIRNGADVKAASCGDATALFWACQQGYLDMVKLLVDNEADVNGRALSKMTWGPALIDNWSNLHMAAHAGHSDVVEYLLNRGADIHARCARGDEDLTPLHMAARNGRVDAVRVLLAKGADASLKSKGGGTALDFARKENHTDVVELLLKHTAKE